MTDLMNTLYSFVTTHSLNGVWHDPEYRNFAACADRQEEKLRALLDQEGQKILDSMLIEQTNQHSVELELVFQGTMALCRDLNRAFLF